MDKRFVYFLIVAEELNMRRAAEKAYITPQGISVAIKSLEDEYGTPLFVRSPKLRLTTQGEMLLDAIRQIKIIEDNLITVMNGRNYDFRGRISLGILESRYEIVMPDIVSTFTSIYKNVELEVTNSYSYVLEQEIETNKLDMVIVPGTVKSPNLETIHILTENFVLLVSRAMLHKHFPYITETVIDQFRSGIELKDFSNIPLIRYPSYTRFYHVISDYEDEHHFSFTTAFVSNHALSFSRFVQRNVGMAIVPTLFLPRIAEQNLSSIDEEYVYAFPIKELPYCKTLWLAYRKDRHFTKCHHDLIDLIIQTFTYYAQIAPSYL